jgi:rRNA maturation endonuclease Nob1
MSYRDLLIFIENFQGNMRPRDIKNELELYECSNCGKRVESAETRVCRECGGTLLNLSKPRDL